MVSWVWLAGHDHQPRRCAEPTVTGGLCLTPLNLITLPAPDVYYDSHRQRPSGPLIPPRGQERIGCYHCPDTERHAR